MIPKNFKDLLKALVPPIGARRPGVVGDHALSRGLHEPDFAPPRRETGADKGGPAGRSGSSTTPRLGSAVLVIDDDRLLLGVRGKEPNRGKWVLPGGKVEPFESIADAARREIREETGLEILVERQVDLVEIIEPPDEHRVIVFSQARLTGGTICASDDLDQVRFWGRGEIEKLDVSEAIRPVLNRLGWG